MHGAIFIYGVFFLDDGCSICVGWWVKEISDNENEAWRWNLRMSILWKSHHYGIKES